MREAAERPAVIVISSHVARGAVGNRAAVFALETLGFPVWAVPTVILPFHPGHGAATRIEAPAEPLQRLLDDLAESRWAGEVGAILTGYMANAGQVHAVSRFVTKMKARRPGLIVHCDPVIGDVGGLYISEETAIAIRERLLAKAHAATPNIGELAWLAGSSVPDDTTDSVAMARDFSRKVDIAALAVTSAPAMGRGNIANVLIEGDKTFIAEHRRVIGPPNGAGDLFAALWLAHRLDGMELPAAMQRAAGSVFELMARAASRGDEELMPALDQTSLRRPSAPVSLRDVRFARM